MIMKRYVYYLAGNKILIIFIYIFLNICPLFAYCCFWGFLYLLCSTKKDFHHLPTFLINSCAHFLFSWRISATMFTLNTSINMYLKTSRYCITIGKIVIKINIQCPKIFYQCSISLRWFEKKKIPNYAAPKSSIMKK